MSEWSPGIQKVLDHVAATSGWHLTAGWLRGNNWTCPLQSLTGTRTSYCARAVEMGLTRDDNLAVMRSADRDDYDPELRLALLRAARLA